MGDDASNKCDARSDSENVAIIDGKNAADADSQKIEEKNDAFDRIGNCIGDVERNVVDDDEENDDANDDADDDDDDDERKKSSAQSRPGKGSNHHETQKSGEPIDA